MLVGRSFCPCYLVQYNAHLPNIQGHPAFSKAYSRALMARRRDRIPASRLREGQTSLAEPVRPVA